MTPFVLLLALAANPPGSPDGSVATSTASLWQQAAAAHEANAELVAIQLDVCAADLLASRADVAAVQARAATAEAEGDARVAAALVDVRKAELRAESMVSPAARTVAVLSAAGSVAGAASLVGGLAVCEGPVCREAAAVTGGVLLVGGLVGLVLSW